MSGAALLAHLASGTTHVCQCWAITRRDGVTLGFTDHDLPLAFDGITFLADSGMSAKALANSTGLSVDNTEAVGVLRSEAIREEDVAAGRFDDAEIVIWQVQWDAVENRQIRFRGRLGEITRQAGRFEAEMRGQADLLNQPQGRSYLRSCSAVLGDDACAVNLADPLFRIELAVETVTDNHVFRVDAPGYLDRWFEQGQLTVLSGAADGLTGIIKHDSRTGGKHLLTLWHPLRATVAPGDLIALVAGCDKRAETCREKFANFVNFQGFPDMPGEDWMTAVPRASDDSDGGSLVR